MLWSCMVMIIFNKMAKLLVYPANIANVEPDLVA